MSGGAQAFTTVSPPFAIDSARVESVLLVDTWFYPAPGSLEFDSDGGFRFRTQAGKLYVGSADAVRVVGYGPEA